MTYTIYHPDLGPITHRTAGLRAMKRIIWDMAANGATIIIH